MKDQLTCLFLIVTEGGFKPHTGCYGVECQVPLVGALDVNSLLIRCDTLALRV